jgi:hypothetical protein
MNLLLNGIKNILISDITSLSINYNLINLKKQYKLW